MKALGAIRNYLTILGKKNLFILAVLLLAVLVPLVFDLGYWQYTLVLVVLYMYWTTAWNILGGYTGLFAIGNGVYIGIGAYIAGILYVNYGISPWIGLVVAGIVSGVISILIGIPVFRLKSVYYALGTVALLTVANVIILTNREILGVYTGGPDGLKVPTQVSFWNMQFHSNLGYYYVILGMLVVALIISAVIEKTKMGYQFKATSANEDAAASLGINVLKAKLIAQFISAVLTSMGGVFYMALLSYVDANTVFGFDLSVQITLMVLVGGVGTLWGPVLGAGLLIVISQITRTYFTSIATGFSPIIYGLLLCIVIFAMPKGLMGGVDKLFGKRWVRKAKQAVSKEAEL